MTLEDSCLNCSKSSGCSDVYEQLRGRTEPGIFRMMAAFLLPIAVFIAAFVICERVFGRIINSQRLALAISVVLAVWLTFICILITSRISRRWGTGGSSMGVKGDKESKRKSD